MTNKQKISYYVAAVFSLTAMFCLFYLANQHWALKLGIAGAQSLCNINDTFNCDAVSASKFASLLGAPLALWGVCSFLLYLCILTAAYFARIPSLFRHQFYIATFFLEMSALMAIISVVFMTSYCLFCIATYVCSIVIYFCAKNLNEDGYSKFSSDFKEMFTNKKAFLGVYACIPLITFMVQDASHGDNLRQMDEISRSIPSEWGLNPKYDFTAKAGFKMGASDKEAKVIVVEFADFLCPHCKFALPSLKAFVKAHKDVQLRFYSFPLSSECNDAISGPGPHRCRLAHVSYCAEKIASKGAIVTQELFENQGSYLSDNVFKKISALFSIDEKELTACSNSPEANDAIRAQAKAGENAKIRGTPSIFVNGRKLPYGAKLPFLNAVYGPAKKAAN